MVHRHYPGGLHVVTHHRQIGDAVAVDDVEFALHPHRL